MILDLGCMLHCLLLTGSNPFSLAYITKNLLLFSIECHCAEQMFRERKGEGRRERVIGGGKSGSWRRRRGGMRDKLHTMA